VKACYNRALPLLAFFLLTGCAGWQSALDAHGASAISIKQLIILIVLACSVVWMLVMMALIAALRRGRTEQHWPKLDSRHERGMSGIVIAATVVTTVVIGGFTVASFFTTRALSAAGPDDLTIRVGGSQWWWNVE
jgi:cytochrome c oxidase subunit 2